MVPVAAIAVTDPTTALRWGAVLCAAVLITRIGRLRIDTANVFATLLTLWAVMSQTWTVQAELTELAITNQIAVLVIFLTVRTVISKPRDLRIIGWGYLAGCGYAIATVIPKVGPETARYGIEGLNVNYLAYALVVGTVVATWLWADAGKLQRLTLAALVVGNAYLIYLTGTRAAWIAAALIALWVVFARTPARLRFGVVAVSTGIVALAILTGAADALLLNFDDASARATGDLSGRITIWPTAREAIGTGLFIGLGAGTFPSMNVLNIGAHNVLLEIGAGLGLIGILLFAATYIASFRASLTTPHAYHHAGTLLIASAPLYLSGHWELSPAAWLVLALCTRLGVPEPTRKPTPARTLRTPTRT